MILNDRLHVNNFNVIDIIILQSNMWNKIIMRKLKLE